LPFGNDDLNFLGMVPRTSVDLVDEKSPAIDKLQPGDAFVSIEIGGDRYSDPTLKQVRDALAGAGDKAVAITVLSQGDTQPHTIANLHATVKVDSNRMGLGICLSYDERHPFGAVVVRGCSSA
jgi:C-terminal processing protease CtpA/Prc